MDAVASPHTSRDSYAQLREVAEAGSARNLEKLRERGKLPARERLQHLLDAESFLEDGVFANVLEDDLPADGVLTGFGRIAGRPVAVMANDPTVKAGSWGAKTVEKIIRIQEAALKWRTPICYLVDSAGARITDQLEMFPGRRHAGRIFHNEVELSGRIPQICLLFGPSAAGGAYIPAFCDVVVMVEGNASMYLGSPRMVELVVGEKVGLEELGGARMHCSVSGCGDVLVADDGAAIAFAKNYLSFFPSNCGALPPNRPPRPVSKGPSLSSILPKDGNAKYDMYGVIEALVDEQSFLEIKRTYAPELITGLACLWGMPIGVVASQPSHNGGVLFTNSADKAARFVSLCDAYSIPLLFLADVPGFMIGTHVEREGIIRHGAKMISAISVATVPKVTVIVRKAYGAGLYAMGGPAFGTDYVAALPTAEIAVMGPAPAVNAVYYNKLANLSDDDRAALRAELEQEYRDGIDLLKLANNLSIDDIVEADSLRRVLVARLRTYAAAVKPPSDR